MRQKIPNWKSSLARQVTLTGDFTSMRRFFTFLKVGE